MEIEIKELDKSIRLMMASHGMDSINVLAKDMEMPSTTLRGQINRNSMRLVDFIRVADILGYTIVAKRKKGESE